ncbi:MAG: sugar porter family MFS transporter [Pseudomonadota bacterium]
MAVTDPSNPAADAREEAQPGYVGLICLVATIGGFLFGFDSGVINGTVDGLREAFASNSIGTGFNVASMLLGCAAGAFGAGRLADRFGRRAILLVAAACFMVSAWGSGAAGSSLAFVLYRIVGGLAVGAASVLAPAYISEVAPARIRGGLISLQQIMIIIGLTVAFVSNYALALVAGSSTAEFWLGFRAWQWMYWVEILPAAVFLLALLLIPESPRYLMLRGERERARGVLARLFGTGEAARKVTEIEASLAQDHHAPTLMDLIDPATRRVRTLVWAGIGLAAFQQLVGINVVFYYGAVLWQSVGFAESDALLINIVSGAVSIIACLLTIASIDRIGRKPLLLGGSIGMAVTLAGVAIAFASASVDGDGQLALSERMGLLALVSANAYVFVFNMSWGPVMWVMLGEMFPNQIRGSALAVSGFVQWGTNFAITMTFPIMLATIGLVGAYGFYCLCATISAVFVVVLVRETRGRELEAMTG